MIFGSICRQWGSPHGRRSYRALLFFALAVISGGGTVRAASAASGPATAPSAAAGPILQPDPVALRAFLAGVQSELNGDILPFWRRRVPDRKSGGFVGEIANDLAVNPAAQRGALLTARILWTFSAAYRRHHDPACLEIARRAYADLTARFLDSDNGGLIWSVNPDGTPRDVRKAVYLQAFGIHGLSEYYLAAGDPMALGMARSLRDLIEKRARDRVNGGYGEEYSRDWRLQTDLRRSLLGSRGLKSQNVHLHVMEAYTSLLRTSPDPVLKRDLAVLTELMLTRVLDPGTHHLRLFMDNDWTPQSDGISFGHDIEFSWLVCEAADATGVPALRERARKVSIEIAGAVLAEGVDSDGGLFNEAGPAGLTNTNKDWWPQAEALVGFFNAFQISNNPKFLAASMHTWDFITQRIVDKKKGEWFWSVTREGQVIPRLPKVGLWKCPYHNGRACMELVDRLSPLVPPEQPGRP